VLRAAIVHIVAEWERRTAEVYWRFHGRICGVLHRRVRAGLYSDQTPVNQRTQILKLRPLVPFAWKCAAWTCGRGFVAEGNFVVVAFAESPSSMIGREAQALPPKS